MPPKSLSAHAIALVGSDGETSRVRVREDESILEAAERNGVLLPFGCRTGACATCTARLLEGEVEHCRSPRALKARHREGGYVLPCIARPRTDSTLRVGADVADELVPTPFRAPRRAESA